MGGLAIIVMPLQHLIINADDFGRNKAITSAVIKCFEKKYCTNATIMANMPGFDEASELAHQNQFADRVGLHLNLFEGMPLTEHIKKQPRICDKDGFFLKDNRIRLFMLSNEERDALKNEINAQIDRCKKKKIMISHIDSHCHTHNELGIALVLARIAKEHGIKHIRQCNHMDTDSTWWKNFYRFLINLRFKKDGLSGSDFFGTFKDAKRLNNQILKPFTMEVMIHPILDIQNQVIDVFEEGTLEFCIKKLYGDMKHLKLHSYRI